MTTFLALNLNGEILLEILTDTLLDLVKLLPCLFVTYLLMEFLEHRAKEKTVHLVTSCGRLGPFAGALTGILPQCGFSASAAGLFSGGVISMGTLAAVFLSTSDEMLPILISNLTPLSQIIKILGIKLLCAAAAGFLLDLMLRTAKKQKAVKTVHEVCHKDNCHCHERGILSSALHHTFEIILFIGACSLLLNLMILFIGEDSLSAFLSSSAFLGPLVSCLVGLIPNCASSVLITQLWMEGALTSGSLIGGLLTGSGIGLLVLFKTNRPMKENFFMLGFVYAVGAICGILLDLFGLVL